MKNWMTILMITWMMRTLTLMELPQHPLSMQLIHMEVLWEVFWTLIHMDLQSLIHLQRNLLQKNQLFLEKCLTLFLNHHFLNQKSKAVKSQILQKTQPYPKSKAVFIPSQQIQTIFPIIQKQDHPKRISRKKLFLKEKKKEKEHVFVTLEKFWKKHFGVFTNF